MNDSNYWLSSLKTSLLSIHNVGLLQFHALKNQITNYILQLIRKSNDLNILGDHSKLRMLSTFMKMMSVESLRTSKHSTPMIE